MNYRAIELINSLTNQSEVTEADRKELDALAAILDGRNQEYYTELMFNTLSKYVDYGSMSDEDYDKLMTMFFNTPNAKKPKS